MTSSVSALPHRTRAVSRTLAALALVVSLAACGATPSAATRTTAGTGTTSISAAVPAGTESTSGSAAVPKLLQFSAPLVGGGEFAGPDHAGRAIAFWFWAPT